ncbi:MAG: hypothetical protein IKK11_04580 [Oscillospiraceae bacterium]|nr:hypothetical protein [Oscillospiraceae bacterium]
MKRIWMILAICLLLTGCGVKTRSVYRVVTGVEVAYSRAGDTLYRTYTKQASMGSILTYLRLLRPFGPTVPKESFDTSCTIKLQYSDGTDSVYLQQGNRYLRRDGEEWQNIDRSRATLLYPLLLLLPSDA